MGAARGPSPRQQFGRCGPATEHVMAMHSTMLSPLVSAHDVLLALVPVLLLLLVLQVAGLRGGK